MVETRTVLQRNYPPIKNKFKEKSIGSFFPYYAEYIMLNARLDEAQAGIKIAGRNINNLRLQMTLLAESKEELKSLLMKVKQKSEKGGLKAQY